MELFPTRRKSPSTQNHAETTPSNQEIVKTILDNEDEGLCRVCK